MAPKGKEQKGRNFVVEIFPLEKPRQTGDPISHGNLDTPKEK